jgi:hypothetical protein
MSCIENSSLVPDRHVIDILPGARLSATGTVTPAGGGRVPLRVEFEMAAASGLTSILRIAWRSDIQTARLITRPAGASAMAPTLPRGVDDHRREARDAALRRRSRRVHLVGSLLLVPAYYVWLVAIPAVAGARRYAARRGPVNRRAALPRPGPGLLRKTLRRLKPVEIGSRSKFTAVS